jgi:hypothetical protein
MEKMPSVQTLETPEAIATPDASPLEKKYREELLPILEILKPEDVTIQEYEDQVLEDLYQATKLKQVQGGKLSEDPLKTLSEMKEVLLGKIDSIILDAKITYRRTSAKDNPDPERMNLVRRALLASLYLKDMSVDGVQTIAGPHGSYQRRVDVENFYRFLNKYQHQGAPLSGHELDELAKMGYAGIIMDTPMYSFTSEYIAEVPESVLMGVEGRHGLRTDEWHNIKNALSTMHGGRIYSRECFKHLVTKGAPTYEHPERFDGVSIEDWAIAHAIARTGPDDMISDLVREVKDHDGTYDNSFYEKVAMLLRHHIVFPSFDKWPHIQEKYQPLLDEVQNYRYGRQEMPIDRVKEIIEQGHFPLLARELSSAQIRELADKQYDWLLSTLKQNNQAHLMLRVPNAIGNIMKPDDILTYVKELIASDHQYLFTAMATHDQNISSSDFFPKYALDQEIYNFMAEKGAIRKLSCFKNLNGETFIKHVDKLRNSEDSTNLDDILSFDLPDTEEFRSWREYQNVIRAAHQYFPDRDELKSIYSIAKLSYHSVQKRGFDTAKETLREQSKIIDEHCASTGASRHQFFPDYHSSNFSYLWDLPVEEFRSLIGYVDKIPRLYDEELELEAMKLVRSNPALQERLAEDIKVIKEVIKDNFQGVCGMYFEKIHGIPLNRKLEMYHLEIPAYTEAYVSFPSKKKKFFAEIIPWSSALEQIYNIQRRASKEKHDPWVKELDPLLRHAINGNLISLNSAEDGRLMYEFVSRFGMRDLPNLFELYLKVRQTKSVDTMDDALKQELLSAFGIDAEKVCRKDKTNMGLVLSELEKVEAAIRSDIIADSPAVVEKLLTSSYAAEFADRMIGKSSFGSSKREDVLKTFKSNFEKKPALFALPKEYAPVDVSIPERVVGESEEKETQIKAQRERILMNPELSSTMAIYDEALEFSVHSSLESIRTSIQKSFRTTIDDLQNRLAQEEGKEAVIDKAVAGLKMRLEAVQTKMTLFEQSMHSLAERDLAAAIDAVYRHVPDDFPSKRLVLLGLTLKDIRQRMPEGYRMVAETRTRSSEEKISTVNEFLTNHVREHYLNKKHSPEESIESSDKGLLKALRKYWGVQDYEKSIIAVSAEKLRQLDQGEIGTKFRALTFFPSKGLQRAFTGDLGDACTSGRGRELAEGKYQNVISYSIILDKGTKREQFGGSFLIIEATTDDSRKALILRANNPSQNLLSSVDGTTLIESIIEEARKLAKRRGAVMVGIPLDNASASCSNRPDVANYYSQHFSKNEKIGLKKTDDTTFNGYDIWNANGAHPVVRI